MDLMNYIWLGLVVVFLIVEAACPIHLVSLWFVAGALAALAASFLGAALWLQMLLFVVVSAGLLILLWPLAKKYMNPAVTATNVDAVVGKVGIVTAAIDNVEATGQVKLGGMEWTARSANGENIPVGAKVKVERIEGVKAFVSPAEVPAVTK